jgi:DNA segregation ATPase FtsK/SpoIIIE-like protein
MFAPDVLVPELKPNLQTRICFPVADIDDSFLIVHEEGAEKLKTGEFLYKSPISPQVKKIKV